LGYFTGFEMNPLPICQKAGVTIGREKCPIGKDNLVN